MKFDEMTESWILDELNKLKYSLKLNDIFRYNLIRQEDARLKTQSVSEHVYNLIILAHYFKDLEDNKKMMDFQKIIRMILMHDMAEIETGDIMMHLKTETQKEYEKKSIEKVILNSPSFISKEIKQLYEDYNNYSSLEGKYVKALDKLEQQLWHSVYCDPVMICSVCTQKERDQNELKRREVYKKCGFKIIEKYSQIIHKQMCVKCPEYSTL